jgi:8-oxo-dGTP diphosphatase
MIEVIARGIIRNNGKILLCRNVRKNAGYIYFPGGHVEFGETSREALIRELVEEMGVRVKSPNYIGGVEHTFTQDGILRHELNVVYEVHLDTEHVESHEPDTVSFHWRREDELENETILPESLKQAVSTWLHDGKPFWVIS